MTRDNVKIAVDQNRNIEAKGLDAIGDLPDLPVAVQPWVRRIKFKLLDWPVNDFERLGAPPLLAVPRYGSSWEFALICDERHPTIL